MYLSGKTTFATGRTEAAYPADVRLVNDGKFIYISVDAANPAAPGGKPGKNCWDRDGFEMVFSTVGGKASSACQVVFLDRFGQLQVGSRNASSIPLTEADIRWKTTQRQGAWTTEVAIPLDKLAIGPENDFFALWGRANCEQDEITASAPNTNSFHDWQATRRCRLLNSPLALLLPATFPCDSRVFKKPLVFRNFSSAPLSGELRVCRTAKAFDKRICVLYTDCRKLRISRSHVGRTIHGFLCIILQRSSNFGNLCVRFRTCSVYDPHVACEAFPSCIGRINFAD
jgi:hypothetical protein